MSIARHLNRIQYIQSDWFENPAWSCSIFTWLLTEWIPNRSQPSRWWWWRRWWWNDLYDGSRWAHLALKKAVILTRAGIILIGSPALHQHLETKLVENSSMMQRSLFPFAIVFGLNMGVTWTPIGSLVRYSNPIILFYSIPLPPPLLISISISLWWWGWWRT